MALTLRCSNVDGRRQVKKALRVRARRTKQRRPIGDATCRIRAASRRVEAWVLIYLAISNHVALSAGIGGGRALRRTGEWTNATDYPQQGQGSRWSRGCEEVASATHVSHGRSADTQQRYFGVRDKEARWWAHASRVGEATHPGPSSSTIATIGLLRRTCDRVRAAVSYPKPGSGSLRGAVAPGYRRTEGANGGQDQTDGEVFKLKVEAVNSTGWRALQRRLMATEAQVILAQETWLTQDAVPAASAWAKRRGWQSIWAAAVPGPSGGASRGVAVLVRDGIGCRYPPGGSHIISPGRAVAAVVQAPGHRPTVFVSCYLHHGRGPSGENLEVLAAIGKRVKSLPDHVEHVIGGDLNMEPPDIATTGIQEEIDSTIMAPATSRGTFRGHSGSSLLDYFLVSNRLAAAVDKMSVVEAAGIKGHTPVLMEFKARVTTLRALHLRNPPAISAERVYGPLLPPPDWGRARKAADDALRAARRSDSEIQRYLDDAYRAWADLAEEELADFAASPPKKWGERGRLPNLIWRSVVPEGAPRLEYPHAAAASWLAATAKEMRRISEDCEEANEEDEQAMEDVDTDPTNERQEQGDAERADRETDRARGRKPPASRRACSKVVREIKQSLDTDMPDCGAGEIAQELAVLRDRVSDAADDLLQGILADIPRVQRNMTRRQPEGTDDPRRSQGEEVHAHAYHDAIGNLCRDIEEVEARATAHRRDEE